MFRCQVDDLRMCINKSAKAIFPRDRFRPSLNTRHLGDMYSLSSDISTCTMLEMRIFTERPLYSTKFPSPLAPLP